MLQVKSNRILYDPLSWIHPNRHQLSEILDTIRCRSIINDMLIERYALPLRMLNNKSSLECLFINNWHILPQAAFRLACLRRRSQLAVSSNIIHLDERVRQFAMLDNLPSIASTGSIFDEALLWRGAFMELWCYAECLSEPLVKRLPLLFSDTDPCHDDLLKSYDPDPLLLRLAIQHAK